jgi:hypothetical protein
VDHELADEITERAFPTVFTFAKDALRDTLCDVVPMPEAWTVIDAGEASLHPEVLVLAGRAVYRLKASVELGNDERSECGCDLCPITPTARFFLSRSRLVTPSGDGSATKTVGNWRFDLGTEPGMEFSLHTERIEGRAMRAGDAEDFAVALATKIPQVQG